MQLKKSMLTIICTLAVIILCSVNTTYAWENMEQSAINITAGEATQVDPDNPDKPDEPDDPDKPDDSDKPDTPDKPDDSDKPEKDPETTDKPQEPSKAPDSSSVQTGKTDTATGDTHEFLLYLFLMLLSFAFIIAIGVTLIILTTNIVETRRR